MNCRDIAELAPLYSSGELEAPGAAVFQSHLKTCSSCADEMERQAYFDARLREIVLSDDIDVNPMNRRVRLQIASVSRANARPNRLGPVRRRWTAAAMGIAAVLLLFSWGYYDLFGRRVAGVYAAAAADHRIEVVELQSREWVGDSGQIKALAQEEGVPESAVFALASGKYHLNRARLCRLDGRVFLHLVFSDGGQEFSVYLRHRDSKSLPGQSLETANGKSLHASDFNNEHVASFETPQLTFVVVTDQSEVAALNIARFASSVL